MYLVFSGKVSQPIFFLYVFFSVSICLIFVIGKKFDYATFAANFKKWKKIKNIKKTLK
jgi:hypothetical protein